VKTNIEKDFIDLTNETLEVRIPIQIERREEGRCNSQSRSIHRYDNRWSNKEYY